MAEIGPARRRTGADLRAALAEVPAPDDRFADDIAAALALLTTHAGRVGASSRSGGRVGRIGRGPW
jgi:hypothetical protein